LWSDLGATLAHDTGLGTDILGGAVKRDDSSSDTLYFKFHVNPSSEVGTEQYLAGFQLFEGDTEGLGVGNGREAWAYSAFGAVDTGSSNKAAGEIDFNSSHPDASGLGAFFRYELTRRGIERTIVFKVQYVAGGNDLVTVYLEPDLSPGATEAEQSEKLITRFSANASFDQIRLRHVGGGGGWTFSDMAIATSFSDLIPGANPDPGSAGPVGRGAFAFSFRAWQREQGLPQNLVRAVVQTRDGYIWVGTDDGIARFDGVRFVSFGWREGMRAAPVRQLFEDSRGGLWIGSVGAGLTRFQDGQFTTFTVRDGLASDSITALAEDDNGRLWVGTESGINVWEGGRWAAAGNDTNLKGRAITTFFKDNHGGLWVGAAGAGVFQFRGGKFQPFTEPQVENLLLDTHCLLVDHGGRIWLGAGDDFLLCRDGNEWRRYRIPRHLARPYVTALAESPDGAVWAGSVSEGLFQFKNGKLLPINAASGMLDNFVESLMVDREGNLWVGTGAGLSQLRHKNVSAFGPDEGVGYGAAQGLCEIGAGTIWAAKPNDGLYRWDGRMFSRLSWAGPSRPDQRMNALLPARDGSCWVAGGQGLWHCPRPGESADEVEGPMLGGHDILSLAEDREGIWAGTSEGKLWRVQNGNATVQTNFPRTSAITTLLPEADGSIWVGTDGAGLYRFQGSVRAHYSKSAQTAGPLSDFIRALHRDGQGVLWIGTAGGGLTRLEGERFTTFTSREGLPDDTISQILEDDSGRLWLGSNRGIASVTRDELEELASGKTPVVYPRIYGRAEGMLSEECTGGYCPAGLKTKSGLLWFSTLKGIVAVDPRPKSDAPAPAVVLEDVLVDGLAADAGKRISVSPQQMTQAAREGHNLTASSSLRSTNSGGLQISPGRHRVEIRYTGLSFSAPERVRFRYRMENLDADWVEAGLQRSAIYSYVPPGKYRFHVIACNSDGIWNEAGADLSLQVLPYFWQNRWFISLASLGLLASVGGATRLMERRKHQRRLFRIEQERALERERARIAEDLHDDLGSSLTRISLLSDLAKADKDNPGQVELHADKISQSAAQTVRALEEIVWAVRPGSDSLQSLVEYIAHVANEMFSGSATRCRLDIPHDLPPRVLPPEMRHNIFLIVKEALTNALKHSAAGEVTVGVKSWGNALEIRVQDDGKGFNPPAHSEDSARNGLGNMRRRSEAIGAILTLESSTQQGATVRLKVRFPNRSNGA
jgi:ligand-binding sensor domain-containing protein/signal transduction histidine kinase